MDFRGQDIWIGLDVHLRSWSVTVATEHVVCRTFSISHDSGLAAPRAGENFAHTLHRYLVRHYPGGIYHSVYEAGFCGFSAHRELTVEGIDNIVVNPADIPTSQKETVQKTDKKDSRKLALALRAGQLRGIYIPRSSTVDDRLLLRVREGLVSDMRRYKNQIKSMLNFYGIKYHTDFGGGTNYFSKRFLEWVRGIELNQPTGMYAKDMLVNKVERHRQLLLDTTIRVRELACTDRYAIDFANLKTIPGVSLITSMALLTEIEDIARFGSTKKFIGFLGLHPTCHSSGETQTNGYITFRYNRYLRSLLVESAHIAVQKDPALMHLFSGYRKAGKEYNVAVIKIARKLACRIYYMLRDKHPYSLGVV